jgi:hypothetical protein
MEQIPNNKLQLAQIPGDDASFAELCEFAHTFNGYQAFGSFEACAEIANRGDHSTLSHLRACLFFEARRWRHFGEDPDPETLAEWRQLISKIREKVGARRS